MKKISIILTLSILMLPGCSSNRPLYADYVNKTYSNIEKTNAEYTFFENCVRGIESKRLDLIIWIKEKVQFGSIQQTPIDDQIDKSKEYVTVYCQASASNEYYYYGFFENANTFYLSTFDFPFYSK